MRAILTLSAIRDVISQGGRHHYLTVDVNDVFIRLLNEGLYRKINFDSEVGAYSPMLLPHNDRFQRRSREYDVITALMTF
jgi:hypothetical protein